MFGQVYPWGKFFDFLPFWPRLPTVEVLFFEPFWPRIQLVKVLVSLGHFWPRLPTVKVLIILVMVLLLATLAMNTNDENYVCDLRFAFEQPLASRSAKHEFVFAGGNFWHPTVQPGVHALGCNC